MVPIGEPIPRGTIDDAGLVDEALDAVQSPQISDTEANLGALREEVYRLRDAVGEVIARSSDTVKHAVSERPVTSLTGAAALGLLVFFGIRHLLAQNRPYHWYDRHHF